MPRKHKNRDVQILSADGEFLRRLPRGKAVTLVAHGAGAWVDERSVQLIQTHVDPDGIEAASNWMHLKRLGHEPGADNPHGDDLASSIRLVRQGNSYRFSTR